MFQALEPLLSGGFAAPRLLDNSLEQIRQMPSSELSRAARNMQRLLQMTPANANLNGTSFEPLITLAPVLGVSTQSVLAQMLQRSEEHTSELQSRGHLVCRLLLEKKNM